MDWFINNWQLCVSFAVALFIAWMVFFKQEFESNRDKGKSDNKAGRQGPKDNKNIKK
jgi:low affinity Fe/Cu permease